MRLRLVCPILLGEPGVLGIELLAHGEDVVGIEDRTHFSVDGFGDKEDS